jgi:biopolymer transport protein ExbD
MAPMIDMVFLLLVFFMTVSTLAKDARPEVELPLSALARVPEYTGSREVLTMRQSTGEQPVIYWGSEIISDDHLHDRIKERCSGGVLLLRGPGTLTWQHWQPVLNACSEAGVEEVIFATFEE